MSTFKEMMERDIHNVFLNTDDFAELHQIMYDGETFSINIVLDNFAEDERQILAGDYAQGVFREQVTVYAAYSDMNVLPKKGQRIQIDDKEYYITKSACEIGQIVLNLEAYNE